MSFIETRISTYSGLSTDIKPTIAAGDDVPNGSRWREIDAITKQITYFYFNIADDAWYLVNQRSIIYDLINDRQLELETNGSVPVTLQDQTTPAVIVYANQVAATTTIAVAPVAVDDYTIEVASITGIIVGHYLGIFSLITNRYYAGIILDITDNVITLDTPLDSDFEIGDTVGSGIRDLSVNGSVTPEIFSLRGADPGIAVTIDVTRVMLQMTTNNAALYTSFGDIVGGLTRGLVVRRVDGSYYNIFNVKTNSEIALIAFDYDALDSSNPSGTSGVKARLTFAGQSKMGVVQRIGPGEDLQVLVQDDLTDLLSFNVVFEGSVAIV